MEPVSAGNAVELLQTWAVDALSHLCCFVCVDINCCTTPSSSHFLTTELVVLAWNCKFFAPKTRSTPFGKWHTRRSTSLRNFSRVVRYAGNLLSFKHFFTGNFILKQVFSKFHIINYFLTQPEKCGALRYQILPETTTR